MGVGFGQGGQRLLDAVLERLVRGGAELFDGVLDGFGGGHGSLLANRAGHGEAGEAAPCAWDNTDLPCCSAAVNKIVQRTMTQGQAAAWPQRARFFAPATRSLTGCLLWLKAGQFMLGSRVWRCGTAQFKNDGRSSHVRQASLRSLPARFCWSRALLPRRRGADDGGRPDPVSADERQPSRNTRPSSSTPIRAKSFTTSALTAPATRLP
jgi:hypothetical protein